MEPTHLPKNITKVTADTSKPPLSISSTQNELESSILALPVATPPERAHFTDSRLANLGARAVFEAFEAYQNQFKQITLQAKTRFEQQDWHGMQADASERLELYKLVVNQTVAHIHQLLAGRLKEKLVWASMKAVYSGLISDRNDWDLAETFFNSITRQIFATVGLDPQIEFVDSDFETPPNHSQEVEYHSFNNPASTIELIKNIFRCYPFEVPYRHFESDVAEVVLRVDKCFASQSNTTAITRAEIVKSVFYRGKGAYIVGRLISPQAVRPLVLALLNTPTGIVVDAILLDLEDIEILFSFTRSYFRVEVERPYDLVRFLKAIMPSKRLAELYNSIGYNKHGKTELYRDLLQHLAASQDQFEIARGIQGMVMTVFTLPSYPVVFKLIRDRFAYPKTTTRQQVISQYQRVFQHDRAGRLIDAHEFEHLKFELDRFSPKLLEELEREAAQSVTVEGKYLIIKHAYVERRVIPLNLYIKEVEEEAGRAAVLDCGNAIKDLAATNIFTGDMLLKNFGVTRHGRVVFYDYDELCDLTSCNFRSIPLAITAEEELANEPWFSVGEHDVFPEEFKQFLGLQGKLRKAFVEKHANLFEVHFWNRLQAQLLEGEVIDIIPYSQNNRLVNSGRRRSKTS